ncbi:hypothetical protein ACWC09_37345 [Streptomyces sp. NPDC001617]
MIGEWPEMGLLVFELSVGWGEFVDPLGQTPVADLVELMSEVLPQRIEGDRVLRGVL